MTTKTTSITTCDGCGAAYDPEEPLTLDGREVPLQLSRADRRAPTEEFCRDCSSQIRAKVIELQQKA